MTLSVLTTEYVLVGVSAIVGGVSIDPTSSTVKFAFVRSGNPASGDWMTGEWLMNGLVPALDDDGRYVAQVLVGPSSSLQLVTGKYEAWIKVEDAPETVVRKLQPDVIVR